MMDDNVTPVEAELEGGGHTWWYVCGDCHGAVDWNENPCRHCKTPLIWPEWPRKEKRSDDAGSD